MVYGMNGGALTLLSNADAFMKNEKQKCTTYVF